jgi:hypothetical protein
MSGADLQRSAEVSIVGPVWIDHFVISGSDGSESYTINNFSKQTMDGTHCSWPPCHTGRGAQLPVPSQSQISAKNRQRPGLIPSFSFPVELVHDEHPCTVAERPQDERVKTSGITCLSTRGTRFVGQVPGADGRVPGPSRLTARFSASAENPNSWQWAILGQERHICALSAH